MSAAVLALLAVTALPPVQGPPAKLDGIVVDAITECPKGADGEILVCGRHRGPKGTYLLPKLDPRFAHIAPPQPPAPIEGGAPATGTCSATGASGATGCALGAANDWGAWKREEEQNGRTFPW